MAIYTVFGHDRNGGMAAIWSYIGDRERRSSSDGFDRAMGAFLAANSDKPRTAKRNERKRHRAPCMTVELGTIRWYGPSRYFCHPSDYDDARAAHAAA